MLEFSYFRVIFVAEQSVSSGVLFFVYNYVVSPLFVSMNVVCVVRSVFFFFVTFLVLIISVNK